MGKVLYTIGVYLLGSAFKRILLGSGLALVSSQVILTLIQTYISYALSNTSFGTSSVLSFLGISGSDVAISVLIGAITARATIEASKLGLKKIST